MLCRNTGFLTLDSGRLSLKEKRLRHANSLALALTAPQTSRTSHNWKQTHFQIISETFQLNAIVNFIHLASYHYYGNKFLVRLNNRNGDNKSSSNVFMTTSNQSPSSLTRLPALVVAIDNFLQKFIKNV